jgi:F-type H+-transporting ATPase subunit gamma
LAQAVRDIRRRIKAVKSTQQITRAMQMVAAAKLRKAQTRAVSARAYATKLTELLGRLTSDGAHAGHSLLTARPARKISVLLVTADRGLAGSYNTNLFRRTEAALDDFRRGPDAPAIELSVVGRKGRDYFRRRGQAIAREDIAVADDNLANLAREYAIRLIDRFSRGQTDAVVVIYSRFVSTMQQKPAQVRLLPVAGPESAGEAAPDPAGEPQAGKDEAAGGADGGDEAGGAEGSDEAGGADGGDETGDSEAAGAESGRRGPVEAELRYVYEPGARSVYSLLLPKFVTNQLFQAFLEARASEYAARMTAMAAATDNADDLIGRLTQEMHHARQASITQEIMELVSGAEALKEK